MGWVRNDDRAVAAVALRSGFSSGTNASSYKFRFEACQLQRYPARFFRGDSPAGGLLCGDLESRKSASIR